MLPVECGNCITHDGEFFWKVSSPVRVSAVRQLGTGHAAVDMEMDLSLDQDQDQDLEVILARSHCCVVW